MSALAQRAPAQALMSGESAASGAWPWRRIEIARDIGAIAAEWRELQARALVTPYQAHGWVAAFVATVGAAHGMEFRHAILRDAEGAAQAILPLVITRRSGVRFAEFIGGKHANYHMGLYAPAFAAALDSGSTRAMLAAVGSEIGGLDGFVFVNQPVAWRGVVNPMALLATGPSPSAAYKLALSAGDCEGTLRRALSTHAHKKLKNKRNRFAGYGASQLMRARTPGEAARIIDAFLAQKAGRFAAMGIADPFADPAVRAFLLRAAQAPDPAIELYSLDLEGVSVATYVGAVQGQRFSGMATSFDMACEAAKASPGEILLVDLIRTKCHDGIAVFDLGVGEARYKTTICDDRDDLVDTFVPLTLKGRGFALVAKARRAAKRRIKASPTALRIAQRASRWLNRGRAGQGDE